MANSTGRPIAPLILSSDERAYLERQVRRHRVARSLSERCRVILRCADGVPSKTVGSELGIHEHTVGKWRRRFLKDRIEGLLDEARPGRPRTIDDDQVAAIIERTLRSTPKDATHWSIRSMAMETGFSHTTIRRIWNAFGLQPHRSETFKLSTDPLFVDKVRDIVGLYLSPPNRALVLSLDEKSQIQALDIASGFVIGKCYKRHRAAEFLDFLKQVDAQIPNGLDVHIIMDNYATHKTAVVKNWLARRPHYHVHFTPTSASWINQVERWFAELTRKRIRRGVHTSTKELEAHIRAFIKQHNENPKPYRWTKSADEILASVRRFCQKTQQTLCSEF
jgi:transposase